MVDVNSNNLDPGLEAIELFYFAYRAFTARPDAILAERGLARMHHRILYFVARRPGQRVSDLLTTLGVSKQAAHAPLKQLVEAGLIAVEPDAADGRARRLSVTTEGADLETRLSQTQRELLGALFAAHAGPAEQGWRDIMRELAGRVSKGQA